MIARINYTRPPLFNYQTSILDAPSRFTVTEASTKVGKTASHIIWLFEQALPLGPNQSVWWVAPTIGQAKIAYERMKIQISNKALFSFNETNRVITLISGGKIEFKTAEKPDNLYGDDVYAFVFDEFTRAREAAWFALRSTITSTGGKGKFIGNVKGSKNWGHRLALKCKNANPDDKDWYSGYFKITAYDAAAAGMKTKDGRPFIEEIESAKKDLPENVFKELYLAEATDEGSNPFGFRHIKQCTFDISSEPAICFGVDLAKSFDYTVELGLDKFANTCHFERYQKDWRQTTARIKALKKPMAIDSTGVGDPIAEEVALDNEDVEAFKFTEKTRQQILEGLAVAIQKRLITFPEGRITYELEQFEFVYERSGVKYRVPDGEHDDCVFALALAWHKWKYASQLGDGPSVF
jgi:hypothetical protein